MSISTSDERFGVDRAIDALQRERQIAVQNLDRIDRELRELQYKLNRLRREAGEL